MVKLKVKDGDSFKELLNTSTETLSLDYGAIAYKNNNVVTVCFRSELNGKEGCLVCGTLPAEWRPKSYMVVPAYMSTATTFIFADVSENGTVHISAKNTAGAFYCAITYVI